MEKDLTRSISKVILLPIIMKNLRLILKYIFAMVVFLLAFTSCTKKGDIEYVLKSALEVSNRIEFSGHRGGMLGEIAHQYAELGQFEKALEIAEEIEDSFYKDLAFSYIVESLTKEERLDESLEIVHKIDEGTGRDRAYYNLSIAYAEIGEFENALMLSDSIINEFFRSSAMGGIAQKLFEQKNEEDASRMMKRALDLANKMEDVSERGYALSNIAWGYAKIDKFKKAFEVTNSMKSGGKRAIAFAMIGEASLQLGDTIQAVNALVQAYEIASKWDDYRDDKRQRYLARIGTTFFKAGEYEEGIEIVRLIENDIIKTRALAELGYRYKKQEQTDRANALFEEAIEIVNEIENESKRALTMARTAWEFAMVKEQRLAKELLLKALEASDRIDERDHQIRILYWIVWGFIELGEYEKALKLCKELHDSPRDQTKLLIYLAKYQAESGGKLGWKAQRILENIVNNDAK